MKIAIFLPNATFDRPGSAEVGGIETFAFTVGEAWQRLGHDVVLFGGAPKPGRTHRPTTLRLSLHPYWETAAIPDLGTRFQRLVQRLHFAGQMRAAWRREQCDLVLLAKPFDWPIAAAWRRARPDLRIIMGFHGTDFFPGDRFFYPAITAAFAVSAPVAALAEKRVGARPVLIPNPVDFDFFLPGNAIGPQPNEAKATVQERPGVELTKPTTKAWHLVASGRLIGWKGYSRLLAAVARLRDEHQISARLSLAGTGPEQPALERQIAELRLEDSVRLSGRLDPLELRALLRSGELYVQPAIGLEAFSISALEAAATGLPLLLSDRVGLVHYLTQTDALVYPADDAAALVEALRRLHQRRFEPAWADRSARHQRLAATFAPAAVAQQVLALAGVDAPTPITR